MVSEAEKQELRELLFSAIDMDLITGYDIYLEEYKLKPSDYLACFMYSEIPEDDPI